MSEKESRVSTDVPMADIQQDQMDHGPGEVMGDTVKTAAVQSDTNDKGGAVDAIHSLTLDSTPAAESDSEEDESEGDGWLDRYEAEYGPVDQAPTEVKTQLLKPDERLSQKGSLMEIFELSRSELDAILKGEGKNGKNFIEIMNELEKQIWEPARQAAKEAGSGVVRSRSAAFEAVYQEYVAGERFGLQTYSDSTEESRQEWEEVQWYAWFIHEALRKLWKRSGGPLFNKGLKQDAAAQRLWYLMRRWAADNTPSRRLRAQQTAAKKAAAVVSEQATDVSTKQSSTQKKEKKGKKAAVTSTTESPENGEHHTKSSSSSKPKAPKPAAGKQRASDVDNPSSLKTAQDILAHPDTRLGKAGDLDITPETKPLAVIQPATIDPDALLNDLRESCLKTLPEGEDADGNPVYEWFGEGKQRILRFKYPYQTWRFIELCFGHDFDVPKEMETVRQIVNGQYGYCDQSGAREIIDSAQSATVEEAQVLSAMATDARLVKEAHREEGGLIPFSAIEHTKRPQTFDWVEELMNDKKFQSHDYKGALKRLHLKSATNPRLKGMSESTWLYWWQVLGIDKIELTRQQGQVKGIILADYVGLGKTVQMVGWILHRIISRADEETCVADDIAMHEAWLEDNPARPFLLVVPATLISQWAEEVCKFTQIIDIVVYHGDSRQKSLALRGTAKIQRIDRNLSRGHKIFNKKDASRTLIITSYETWQSRHGPQGRKDWMKREGIRENDGIPGFGTNKTEWPGDLNGLFEAVLCDEAHYLKNPDSSQNQSIEWTKSPFTILASATPIWSSILDFLGYIKLLQSPKFANAFVKGSKELGISPRQNPYDLDEGHRAHPVVATYDAYRDFVLSIPDGESALKGSRLKQAWSYVLLRRTYDSSLPADSSNTIRKALPPLSKYVLTTSFDQLTQCVYELNEAVWMKNLMMPDNTKEGSSGDSFIINGRNFRALVLITLFPPFAAYADILEDSALSKQDTTDGSGSRRNWPAGHRLLHMALFRINQASPRKLVKKSRFKPSAVDSPETEKKKFEKKSEKKPEKKVIPIANGYELIPDVPLADDLAAILKTFYNWSPKLRILTRNLTAICLVKKTKAIVWTLYPYEQLFLEAFLNVQGLQARAYISTLDPAERQELQRDFNEAHGDPSTRPGVEVLVASYFTNGVGLNLHHDCSSCHLFDPPPSQAARQQAIGRSYRLGQKKPVEVVEYCLANSFDLYQLNRVTKRAMPAAMSFLDLDKLGVPEVADEGVEGDTSQLTRQLTGWWKHRDGTVVHESNDNFTRMRDSGELSGHVGSPEDLLRHLVHLSRGKELVAYGSSVNAIHNPSLSIPLDQLIEQLRVEVESGNLGEGKERVRMGQLDDLEAKREELRGGDQECGGEDGGDEDGSRHTSVVVPKRKRKRVTSASGSSPRTTLSKKKRKTASPKKTESVAGPSTG